MNKTLTDEELIQHYLLSQPNRCFEVIYNRYIHKVFHQCFSITKDAEKARDFTHDIFLKVFAKLDTFKHNASFSTWLYAVTYNYCADQIRRSKRINIRTFDEELISCNLVVDSTDACSKEEAMYLLQKAMNSLASDDRTLLKLKYIDGMENRDIAQLYTISINAVKMRLKRSRDRMRYFYEHHSTYDTQNMVILIDV